MQRTETPMFLVMLATTMTGIWIIVACLILMILTQRQCVARAMVDWQVIQDQISTTNMHNNFNNIIVICLYGLSLLQYLTVVDCTWNAYGDWSSCSATCGDGTRTHTRTKATSAANGGNQCTGGPTETESCNEGSCPGIILFLLMCHQNRKI